MIHLYTGEGKGKTSAAVGQLIRAAGRGWTVIFAQFMKSGDTGELHVLRQMAEVEILRSQKEFGFYRTLGEEQKKELTDIHNKILDYILEAVQQRRCQMVVLDEITYPVTWGLLDQEKLLKLIKLFQKLPDGPELVMTGRNPADFLVDCADYLTRMDCVRHPYLQGIEAREGIEF